MSCQLGLSDHLELPLRESVTVPVVMQVVWIAEESGGHVQAVQLLRRSPAVAATAVIRPVQLGEPIMKPAHSVQRGLVQLALRHRDNVNVTARRAEVSGHQRAVYIESDEVDCLGEFGCEPGQQAGYVGRE